MARSLYRFYLYAMFVALTIFAVSATAQLLTTLLQFTPLRGEFDGAPSQNALIQSLVFALIGWLIAGTLGGLHYWLIRRDLHSETGAGTSSIRAFFLNATEAGGTLLVVPLIGFTLIQSWAFNYHGNVASAVGIALPTLVMVALFDWERERTRLKRGAALVFQRLHFFGVQLILLSFLISAFLGEVRPLLNGLFFGDVSACGPQNTCPPFNLAGLALTLLWFAGCWLLYSLFTSRDSSRLVRMIMHSVSLISGFSLVLAGVFQGLQLLVSLLFGIPVSWSDILGYGATHDFASPLLTGILVTAVYHWLLHNLSRRGLLDRQTRQLTEWSIAAALLAATFWWGCASLLYNQLQLIAPAPTGPGTSAWVTTIALIATGLTYLPLAFFIRQRFERNPDATLGPRRGLVLTLLGAGTLSFAIGGSTALYAWLTALLGSPLYNWPQIAHVGTAAAIVGALVAGLYLWTLRTEHLFARQPARPPAAPPAPENIEGVLDELLVGKIGREEAAARLHALLDRPVPV